MKKIIIVILICLSFCSCSKKEKMKIYVPSGAPSLAFYNTDFEVMDAGSIKTLVVKGDVDYCVFPTNIASSLIKNGANYLLASTVTFGNLYLVSLNNDDGILDKDDDIVLFQKDGVPDKLCKYLLSEEIYNNVRFVNDATNALREIVSNSANYVLIAEPALRVAKAKNPNISIYMDIQEEYYKKCNKKIFQASLMVKKTLAKKDVQTFLDSLEKDIDALISNPDLLKERIEELNISLEEAQSLFGNVEASISSLKDGNSINIGYEDAYLNKEAIDEFLGILNEEKTKEEYYFK